MTAINEHMANIVATTSYFKGRLKEIDSKLQILLQRVKISGDDTDGNDSKQCDRLQDEKESAKQCLKICAEASWNVSRRQEQPRTEASDEDEDIVRLQQAREVNSSKHDCSEMQSRQATGHVHTNVFEDVLAAQGSCQIITVASANVLSAVRVTAEAGAKQWIGHLSGNTLEELLQDQMELHGGQQEVRKVMGL